MGARKLTRWQKASALVPMALLVGAWGAALANTGLATASNDDSTSNIPDVPATAFEQPASIVETPSGIDPKAGTAGAIANLSTSGIPASALSAYRRAETLLGQADPTCNLPWNLVAAIGRVESNHGRINGSSLNADGEATPGIYGVLLDGNDGRAKVNDTDNGVLDGNSVLDRAVGPMQFIPGTWKSVGVDSDNDGTKNPQDIDDSATAAGIYLCSGSEDLSDPADLRASVLRYNRSTSYADSVIAISNAYAAGDFSQAPDGYSAAPILTSKSYDQTLTQEERDQAKKDEEKANKPKPKPGGNNNGGGGGGSTPGGGDGGTPGGGDGGGGGGTPGGSTGGGVTDLVGGLIGDLTGGGSGGDTGGDSGGASATLTWAEAKAQCLLNGISLLNVPALTACITDLLK